MKQDLQNALAFYQTPPPGWFAGAQAKVEACGIWLWETLQGDFHEDPSTGQIVTGTLISMIPLVDQLCDIRDFIANVRKINEDSSNTWAWVAMALTLIGAVPVFGSLIKGCFKVLVQASRRRFHKKWKTEERDASIEWGMKTLSRYLDMPTVRETMARMKVHNIYQYLADSIDQLRARLSVELLMEGFNALRGASRQLIERAILWDPVSLKPPAELLLTTIEAVFIKAPAELNKALHHVADYLDALGNRLRVEADGIYRARPGVNTHVLGQRQNAELELLERKKPDWVDEFKDAKYEALQSLPSDASKNIAEGWPDIIKTKFNTFHDSVQAVTVDPGSRLYRVVEPGEKSYDNGFFWMREAEFQALTTKSEWRRNFAVWKSWNENGEYLVYTVPPGNALKVWEGRAASQTLELADRYKLEGGRPQIVLDPKDLKPDFSSPRQKTGWGYDDSTGSPDLDPPVPFLGLPDLTHNWRKPDAN